MIRGSDAVPVHGCRERECVCVCVSVCVCVCVCVYRYIYRGCSAGARVPSRTMERPEDTHDPMIHLHCARGVSYRSSDRGAAIQALSSQMMNDPETMREFQEAMASGKGGFRV